MDLGLTNRIAIVTGASSGIGRATAITLAKEGAGVVLAGRRLEKLNNVFDEISSFGGKSLVVQGDLSQEQDCNDLVDQCVEHFGRVDILVNSATEVSPLMTMEATDQDWIKSFTIGLLSVIRLCRRTVPYMQAAKWGRIVNISSSSVKDPSGNATYDSIKAALLSYTKDLSTEVAADQVLVSAVCPGSTLTPMWHGESSVGQQIADLEGMKLDDLLQQIASSIPLKRMGRPEEIADLIAFLVSERASYITGQAFYIDGGSISSAF